MLVNKILKHNNFVIILLLLPQSFKSEQTISNHLDTFWRFMLQSLLSSIIWLIVFSFQLAFIIVILVSKVLQCIWLIVDPRFDKSLVFFYLLLRAFGGSHFGEFRAAHAGDKREDFWGKEIFWKFRAAAGDLGAGKKKDIFRESCRTPPSENTWHASYSDTWHALSSESPSSGSSYKAHMAGFSGLSQGRSNDTYKHIIRTDYIIHPDDQEDQTTLINV